MLVVLGEVLVVVMVLQRGERRQVLLELEVSTWRPWQQQHPRPQSRLLLPRLVLRLRPRRLVLLRA
jgi:hypothetical protein